MKKYKPVLKKQREMLSKIYESVCDPNKTRFENTQRAFDRFATMLKGYENSSDSRMSQLTAISVKGLIDEMNGKVTHYFIKDEELLQFLKDTEIKDNSIIKEYIEENKTALNGYASYYSIALHTEDEGYFFTYLYHEGRVVVVAFDNDYSLDFDLRCKLTDPTSKLAVNLIYYLKAFPEKILDGVPEDMVKNDKKKMSGITAKVIGIADEIVEKTEIVNGHLVSPHFRSGFFRHYSDDRYINMKGKVQFIAATMVKGKAKTVVA